MGYIILILRRRAMIGELLPLTDECGCDTNRIRYRERIGRVIEIGVESAGGS